MRDIASTGRCPLERINARPYREVRESVLNGSVRTVAIPSIDRPPIVVLQSTRVALEQRGPKQVEESASDRPGHRIDAVALREVPDVASATANATRVERDVE